MKIFNSELTIPRRAASRPSVLIPRIGPQAESGRTGVYSQQHPQNPSIGVQARITNSMLSPTAP